MWDLFDVIEALGAAGRQAEERLRLEQAVYGLDSYDEVTLQSVIAEGLAPFFGVSREVYYPSATLAGRKRSGRQRCDVVLTPRGTTLQIEEPPIQQPQKKKRAKKAVEEPGLFAPAPEVMEPEAAPASSPVPTATAEQAMWLEVKAAYQYRQLNVRHAGYGRQWRTAVIDDLKKMEADPLIKSAGLLLIVFNESQEVLDKDLQNFEDILAVGEVLAGFRQVRSVPIIERMGHRSCTLALWPTVQR